MCRLCALYHRGLTEDGSLSISSMDGRKTIVT